MTKILFVDCDGTIREPLSGAKFIQHPHDQKIIKGATEAIALSKSNNQGVATLSMLSVTRFDHPGILLRAPFLS